MEARQKLRVGASQNFSAVCMFTALHFSILNQWLHVLLRCSSNFTAVQQNLMPWTHGSTFG